MVGTGHLAQASMPRLGEINKGLPKVFYANRPSSNQPCFWASKVSLRWDGSRL